MSRILTIGFEFEKIFYYSLIRVREMIDQTEYKITVMNGMLEKILSGNNVLVEKEGHLNIEITEHESQENLKLVIAEALSTLLKIPLRKELKFDKFY